MNLEQTINVIKILFSGIGVSLQIFFLSFILSIPLGILVAVLRNSKCKIISMIMKLYVLVIRGTPIMLQIIIVYFCPYYLFNISYDRFLAIILAFVINYAAYFSEIYRAGIENIAKGQYEAGQVLGMTKTQVFFKVVLFQVIKNITPPMSNEVITLVKDTSLVRVIGVTEIIMHAERFTKAGIIWPLFSTGIYFLLFNGILTILLGKLERKMNYYHN